MVFFVLLSGKSPGILYAALAVFVIVFFLAPAALQKTDASPAQSITKGTSK